MIGVVVNDERLTSLGARVRDTLEETPMLEAGGTAVKRLLLDHFSELNEERHRAGGVARPGFYEEAAQSVENPVAAGDHAVAININLIGLAQRWLGGVISAVNRKYLAIPNPENPGVIGRIPADFPNLKFFPTPRGGGLKMQGEVASLLGTKMSGKNKGKSKSIGSIIGELVLFWLVPSVDQAADPTVMPPDDEMQNAAFTAMDGYLTRRLASI